MIILQVLKREASSLCAVIFLLFAVLKKPSAWFQWTKYSKAFPHCKFANVKTGVSTGYRENYSWRVLTTFAPIATVRRCCARKFTRHVIYRAHALRNKRNLTNWRQFFMHLSCYWSQISSSHCQSSCGSPSGSADYFDNVTRNSLSMTEQTH